MGHELAKGNRRCSRPAWVEVGYIPAHWRVEVERSALHELHDADVGKQLRDGPDAVDRPGGRWCAVPEICDPEPACPDDVLAFDKRDREAGKRLVPHLVT